MTDTSHPGASVDAAESSAKAVQATVEATRTSVADTAGPARAIPATSVKDHRGPRRRWLLRFGGGAIAVVALIAGVRWVLFALSTVSTDDAYVNGHVTFVAPRVPGQVTLVLVDDNNRVHKGDLLVQLDKEPYRVQVNIAQAAVAVAQADLAAAMAQTRGVEGLMRSLRFSLERAIEDVDNQIANLRSKAAALESRRAELAKAEADYNRALPLLKSGAVSQEDFDTRVEARLVAQAQVEEALQGVYQVRVALGLSPQPQTGEEPHAGSRRPGSNVLVGAASAGGVDPGGVAGRGDRFVQQDAEADGCRFLQARSGGEH